ncbi:CHASE domain-containing protein [Qipengyuania sp. JC766]|uniref:CHASE domain-containing protein n=1 Tax=Qipengyuania sp. JC766 TaxID=3232139 RepID=UPI003459D99C
MLEHPRAVPIAIFLLVGAITALSVYSIERGANQREQAQLRERAQAIASVLEQAGSSAAAHLKATAVLMGVGQDVDLPRFRSFVRQMQVADSDGGDVRSIAWAERVPRADIPQFLQREEERGSELMRVYPALQRGQADAYPIAMVEPLTEANRPALGFDISSNAVRAEAMATANATRRPTASGPVELISAAGTDQRGFILIAPVYEGAGNPAPLTGYVLSPFTTQEFLESGVEGETLGNRSVRLYDAAQGDEALLAEVVAEGDTGAVVSERVRIADRDMVLEVASVGTASLSDLSMVTLLFGLLVATLLTVVARLITHQAEEDRASVAWLEEQNSIRNSLTRELNHRVKNTLANVLSIIALTRRRADSLEHFATSLDGRIRALSATHDLLTRSEWGTTLLSDVIGAELAPYANDGEKVVTMEGPQVALAPNDALSLGLAIHELATNAAKYGALSRADGQVSIVWELETADTVTLRWKERGGPAVPQDRQRGFGTDLIEKIVAHELRHPVELTFAPKGVECVLRVPVRERSEFALRAKFRKVDMQAS